jgi:hypothetical protein
VLGVPTGARRRFTGVVGASLSPSSCASASATRAKMSTQAGHTERPGRHPWTALPMRDLRHARQMLNVRLPASRFVSTQ